MKKIRQTQIFLISIGLLLILLTYFYYPYLKSTELTKEQPVQKDLVEETYDERTFFEKVQYQGMYDLDNPFTIVSEKAYILNEEPNVVYMNQMHVVLHLNDGRIVNIFSDKGKYNKKTYDCFFEENVRATDGDTNILADNLDLLATENSVEIYNNVSANFPTGSVMADKIDYDFQTKFFKVSMFDKETVKVKIIK